MDAVIIEDEAHLRTSLADLLELFCPEVNVIGMAENVKKGITLIQAAKPQLVFLDIKLPDGSGFDVLKKLKKEPSNWSDFHLVFTTAFDDFALKAIKVDALDYILKPIDPDELVEVVKKATLKETPNLALENLYHMIESKEKDADTLTNRKISITTADKVYVLNVGDIIRCESQDNYTLFHIQNESPVLVSKTLKDFDLILQPFNFERIHRSHLINLDYLKTFNKTEGGYVLMKDGQKIPVAIRRKEPFLRKLNSYL